MTPQGRCTRRWPLSRSPPWPPPRPRALGAVSYTHLSLYEQVNVGGARVVAEVAASMGIERIVFTSSVAVYGLDLSLIHI